ncbi:MAG: WD40 repeat domain-containing protein [Planctomycetota bacterium]
MKALDKDRGRRYATPADLAEDIGNHIAGEAVEAAPPSAAYRMKKFVRRHKGPTIATAAVATTLLIGLGGTAWGWRAADHANTQLRQDREFASETLLDIVVASIPLDANERSTIMALEDLTESEAKREQARAFMDGYVDAYEHAAASRGEIGASHALSELELLARFAKQNVRETVDLRDRLREQRDLAINTLSDMFLLGTGTPGGMDAGLPRFPEIRGEPGVSMSAILKGSGTEEDPHRFEMWKGNDEIAAFAPLEPEQILPALADTALLTLEHSLAIANEAEWSAYTANLALAQNAMDAGDWPAARRYLAECPESKRGWEWEFLNKQAQAIRFAFSENEIVVESPDREVRFIHEDNTRLVSFVSVSTGEQLSAVQIPSDMHSAAFAPEGDRVITYSSINEPSTSFLLDPSSKHPVAAIEGVASRVTEHSFSSDGAQLVLAHSDGVARIYNTDDGTLTKELPYAEPEPARGVWAAEARFVPNSALVLLAGSGSDVRLYDSVSGQLLQTFATEARRLDRFAVSPDGSRFALRQPGDPIFENPECTVWDIESGKQVFAADWPGERVWDMWFSSDGEELVTASSTLVEGLDEFRVTYCRWNARTGELIDKRATDHPHWRVRMDDLDYAGAERVCVHYGPKGLQQLQVAEIIESSGGLSDRGRSVTLASGTRRIERLSPKTIQFTDPADDRPIMVYNLEESIDDIALTADGQRVLIYHENGNIRVWDIRDAEAHRADARREWAAREAAEVYVQTLWDGPTPTRDLVSTLSSDSSVPPMVRYVAGQMLAGRLHALISPAHKTMLELRDEGAVDKADLFARAEALDLDRRAKEVLMIEIEAWNFAPRATSAEEARQRLDEEVLRRQLAEAWADIYAVDIVADPDHQERLRARAIEAIRVFRHQRVTHNEHQCDAIFGALSTVGVGENRFMWAESAMRAGDLSYALNLVLEAPLNRLQAGRFDDRGARVFGDGVGVQEQLRMAWTQATPSELAVLAMIRFRLSASDQPTVDAASRVDQRLGQDEMTRKGHVEAALVALQRAKVMMKDPKWASDHDTASLIEEADALIGGTTIE